MKGNVAETGVIKQLQPFGVSANTQQYLFVRRSHLSRLLFSGRFLVSQLDSEQMGKFQRGSLLRNQRSGANENPSHHHLPCLAY